jgi:hypothetical protein
MFVMIDQPYNVRLFGYLRWPGEFSLLILAMLAGCTTSIVDLKWNGPNGEVSVFSLTSTEFDLSDNTFPNYPLAPVVKNATHFRIDSGHSALFCKDPFFGPPCLVLPGDDKYYPFFLVPHPASVEIYENEWMSDISKIAGPHTWPNLAWTPWLSYHIEGIAHSSNFLFVATKTDVYRLPNGEDLQQNDSTRISFDDIPCASNGLNHVGDIDVMHDTWVLAPIERYPYVDKVNAKLAMLDRDLNLIACIDLPQRNAGAVAFNPTNHLVYLPGATASKVNAYKIDVKTGAAWLQYTVALDVDAYTGDALAFSESGHLYTAYGANENPLTVAAYNVRGRSATRVATYTTSEAVKTILEGIDIYDATSISGLNSNITGQIHIGLLDNVLLDKWSMMHLSVDNPHAL